MPYRRKYKARPPGAVKRSSEAVVYPIAESDMAADFPFVYYQRILVVPADQVWSIMGVKITAIPGTNWNGGTKFTVGFGLTRLSDMEEEQIENGFSTSNDQRRFRRMFARETTHLQKDGSAGAGFVGGPHIAMVQAHVKGRMTLASGQALYLGVWALGSNWGTRWLDGVIEYSKTVRMAAT